MTAPASRQLIIFARAPHYGAVKTRLAAEIGSAAAWRAYRAMTDATLRAVATSPTWSTRLAVTPPAAVFRGRHWPDAVERMPQAKGDLGRRMGLALAAGTRAGPTVIVGSDIPEMTAGHIQRAFDLLGRHDVVFGPATDGGYWLVGVRHGLPIAAVRCLFDGVRWSSVTALSDTVENVPAGWRIGYATTLSDIDTAADLATWMARV